MDGVIVCGSIVGFECWLKTDFQFQSVTLRCTVVTKIMKLKMSLDISIICTQLCAYNYKLCGLLTTKMGTLRIVYRQQLTT